MIITEIKPVKKVLSLIYIDGEYAMKLDSVVLAENGIRVGCEVDEELLEELREKEDDILQDQRDGIRPESRQVTVNEMFDIWLKLKRGLKNNTLQRFFC